MIINEDFFDDVETADVVDDEVQDIEEVYGDFGYKMILAFDFDVFSNDFVRIKNTPFSQMMKRMYLTLDNCRLFGSHVTRVYLNGIKSVDGNIDITKELLNNTSIFAQYLCNWYDKNRVESVRGTEMRIMMEVLLNKKENTTIKSIKRNICNIMKSVSVAERFFDSMSARNKVKTMIVFGKNLTELTDDDRVFEGIRVGNWNFSRLVYSIEKIMGVGPGGADTPEEYRSDNEVKSIKQSSYPNYFRKLVNAVRDNQDTEMIGYIYEPFSFWFKYNKSATVDEIVQFIKSNMIDKFSIIDVSVFSKGFKTDKMSLLFVVQCDNLTKYSSLKGGCQYIEDGRQYKVSLTEELNVEYIVKFIKKDFTAYGTNKKFKLYSDDAKDYYKTDIEAGLI